VTVTIATFNVYVPPVRSLADVVAQATAALSLDQVNWDLREGKAAKLPSSVDAERIEVELYALDEPWATRDAVVEKIRARSGEPVIAPQLLAVAQSCPGIIREHELLVALGGHVRDSAGHPGVVNLWYDAPSDETGLGLLPEEQEWQRGTCFPYVVRKKS
jgi:hypothetical protein